MERLWARHESQKKTKSTPINYGILLRRALGRTTGDLQALLRGMDQEQLLSPANRMGVKRALHALYTGTR